MKPFFALFVLAATGALAAEPSPGRPAPPRRGAAYRMNFDPATIESVDGTIEKVLVRQMGRMQGVHVLLKTASDTVEVHLGPSWFIDNQETKLEAGDTVNVRGSRTAVAGRPAIIAVDVQRGGETLRLREDDGTPLWSAWRGRGMQQRNP